jgi:hypothetical protein
MTQELKKPVANIFPPIYRNSLLWAAGNRDIRSIDDITDQLVRIGYCRPRSELHHQPVRGSYVTATELWGGERV